MRYHTWKMAETGSFGAIVAFDLSHSMYMRSHKYDIRTLAENLLKIGWGRDQVVAPLGTVLYRREFDRDTDLASRTKVGSRNLFLGKLHRRK